MENVNQSTARTNSRRLGLLILSLLVSVVLLSHDPVAIQGVALNDAYASTAGTQVSDSDQPVYEIGYSDWVGSLEEVADITLNCPFHNPRGGNWTCTSADASYIFQLTTGETIAFQLTSTFPNAQAFYRLPTINYDLSTWEFVLVTKSDVPDIPDPEVRVADPYFTRDGEPAKLLDGAFASKFMRLSRIPIGFPDLWIDISDVKDSIEHGSVYDSSKQHICRLPDESFTSVFPAFPFDGQSDSDTDTEAPRPFLEIRYGRTCNGEVSNDPLNPEYIARVFLFPGIGDTDYLNKPLIVSDAFDSFNMRHAWTVYDQWDLRNLLSTQHKDAPRSLGYDMYFIDFAQGAGDILINASLVLEFIEWMHTQTTADMIVGGPSMSGVVTRLALLYAMPGNHTDRREESLAPRVSGYLSIDSPHQGASLDPSYTRAMYVTIKKLMGIPAVRKSDKVQNAAQAWQQLLQPATYQMLYGHPYIHGAIWSAESEFEDSTEGHQLFYELLTDLGDYNPSIPSAAIAYSNFYVPHPGHPRTKRDKVGHIAISLNIYSFKEKFSAGGPTNATAKEEEKAGFHELAPGSTTARFYYDLLAEKIVNENVSLYQLGGETFKGTFIPIYSALDLDETFDVEKPPTITTEEIAANYTDFDAVYLMEDEFNCYHKVGVECREALNDKRYQHIVFDDQLMQDLASALKFLESSCSVPNEGDWHVLSDCTLNSQGRVAGNVIVDAGVTLTIAGSERLDIDFANHNLRIKPGGKVLIKPGGKIE